MRSEAKHQGAQKWLQGAPIRSLNSCYRARLRGRCDRRPSRVFIRGEPVRQRSELRHRAISVGCYMTAAASNPQLLGHRRMTVVPISDLQNGFPVSTIVEEVKRRGRVIRVFDDIEDGFEDRATAVRLDVVEKRRI